MFTLKFYKHDFVGQADDPHEVFGCERYGTQVERTEEDVLVTVVRMFRTLDDDNPQYATIGVGEMFSTAFVMNNSGKTIDTLR